MNGELAETIALVSYGNYYLTDVQAFREIYSSGAVFQFSKEIEFVEMQKSFFSSSPEVVANTPSDWFASLRNSGCRKLRLYFQYSRGETIIADHELAGMVGGGGTWLIEAVFLDYSDYWTSRWELNEKSVADADKWRVTYVLASQHGGTIDLKRDIDTARKRIDQSLTEIADFAAGQGLDHWANLFNKAKSTLSSDEPKEDPFETYVIVSSNYSLSAKQLFFCAANASVFGGMGSWNDLSFGSEDCQKKYEGLSARLYDDIIQAIMASVNSY